MLVLSSPVMTNWEFTAGATSIVTFMSDHLCIEDIDSKLIRRI